MLLVSCYLKIPRHSPLAQRLSSTLEGVKQGFIMLRNAFPDMNVKVEKMIAEKDEVVSRLH